MTQNKAKSDAKTLRISTASLILTQKEEEEKTDRVVEEKAKSDGERKSDDTQS